jgi:hypothetical protein
VALAFWLVLGAVERAPAQGPGTLVAADSAARSAIAVELRAFYRDLDARHWSSLMTHFWPAKIGARWQHPDWAWPTGPTLAGAAGCANGAASPPAPSLVERSVQIAGRWARAVVPRCETAPPDHFWLLDMNHRWKIVRLSLGSSR